MSRSSDTVSHDVNSLKLSSVLRRTQSLLQVGDFAEDQRVEELTIEVPILAKMCLLHKTTLRQQSLAGNIPY